MHIIYICMYACIFIHMNIHTYIKVYDVHLALNLLFCINSRDSHSRCAYIHTYITYAYYVCIHVCMHVRMYAVNYLIRRYFILIPFSKNLRQGNANCKCDKSDGYGIWKSTEHVFSNWYSEWRRGCRTQRTYNS